MYEHQEKIMEELWEILLELAGDGIALETFCWSGERCLREFGPYVCGAYIKRLEDYTAQHLEDTKHLTGHLPHKGRAIIRA